MYYIQEMQKINPYYYVPQAPDKKSLKDLFKKNNK
jgi:hypothetical protein